MGPWDSSLWERDVSIMSARARELLESKPRRLDVDLGKDIPRERGLYAISDRGTGAWLHAGQAREENGLRQRVFKNHRTQRDPGNLCWDLQSCIARVCGRAVPSFEEAQAWVAQNAEVRFEVIKDRAALVWAEHFLIAMTKPHFSDGLHRHLLMSHEG